MASSADSDLTAFFSQMADLGGVIVRDRPRFDLDLYLQNYVGYTRFDRLMLIGKCCVPLSVDAFKAAVAESKSGYDVVRYKEAWDCIRKAAPGEPEAIRDEAWIEKSEQANKIETMRLETELKGYRNNLIKESIRMGNEDLGRHLESIGQLNEAAESYARMRQDVSSNKHIVDCALHLAAVGIRRRDWSAVLSNKSKILSNIADHDQKLTNYAAIVHALAALGVGGFADAARQILQVRGPIEPRDLNNVLSPSDIALYAGLLALAYLSRAELQDKLLLSQSFRQILDYEPNMRKALSLFYNGRYSDCLSMLESFRTDCLLDVYLQKHVPTLFSRIRSRCITHYFLPFSCVTLSSLESAFALHDQPIEEELVDMIRNGSLEARIDAKNKLLVAVRREQRLELQKNTLKIARQYEEEAKERLRRISLVAAGLEVPGGKKQGLGHAETSGGEEPWYDDGSRSPFTDPADA